MPDLVYKAVGVIEETRMLVAKIRSLGRSINHHESRRNQEEMTMKNRLLSMTLAVGLLFTGQAMATDLLQDEDLDR